MLDQHGFLHLSHSLGVPLVALPQLVLILFDDPLDLRFESFYGLRADLLHLVFLPALLSDLLGGHPGVAVLLELDGKTVLEQFLLLFCGGSVL